MLAGKRPQNIGVKKGKLSLCSGKPNCVCSQDERKRHGITPLKYEGSPEGALQKLKKIVSRIPGATLVEERDGYLYFECATKWLGFVDDLEFFCDAEHSLIHVRSASRLGYSDLGVNRKRVEHIRTLFSTPVSVS
ncbi:hypothetical protein BTA51_17550 [Hahella sp. CCB-MM4]|uniref:DUF1499 domain-containing protein n=1 Tax=Hahella sp. (strain CCB-MM4) TaxID=1926491 RepID=UPI000B9ABCFC|nr:DUF1499 domain-containing protein [Hahella sp. CCB-MM4]OZG72156.1 hypothetical protein BTA51_17550 [Hahella sp. CCB-MM4]